MAGGIIGTSTIQGGTVANTSIGTPTIIGGTVAINGTTVPLNIGAGLAPTVVNLTDAVGTITPNAQAGQVYSLVLGTTAGNRTLGTPANATDGQAITYRIKQNANSTGTLVWVPIYKFNNGTAGTATIGTNASAWNYFGFRYNGSGTIWDEQRKNINIS